MRVIILRGNGDSGKSTTLNMVYDELTTSRYVASVSFKRTIGNSINSDFEAEVVLTDTRVIAFYTMGDYDVKYIIRAIKNFKESKVDILIIASNNNLFTHFNFVISNFPYNLVNKTTSNPVNDANNMICNLQDCGTILSLL